MTAAAAGGWSPLSMPARPAWLGATRPRARNRRAPLVCDPPYMHVCPGVEDVRCRAIIPRHFAYCPDCRDEIGAS